MAVAERVVLASLAPEIVLKGERTRPRFEERLVRNVADALGRRGVGFERVYVREARLFVETSALEEAVETLTRVFGVHWAVAAYRARHGGLEDIAVIAEKVASGWVRGKRFAVRARRSGREPFTSLDVARAVGARLKPYSAGVDLEEPEAVVYVEVRGDTVYIYDEPRRGPDGLPVGVEGRALALFSGGIDSPVAAWMTAKRGVEVDLLHYVLADKRSLAEASAVAEELARGWLYGYRPILIAYDFRPITGAIAALVRRDYAQVVLRAAMLLHASRVAEERGYHAIVTGESLGQVSTQTLANLRALHRVVGGRTLLTLRPLLGMDKEEIVALARKIGTYEASARTREYCRLADGPVTTRADPDTLRRELEKIEPVIGEAVLVEEKSLA